MGVFGKQIVSKSLNIGDIDLQGTHTIDGALTLDQGANDLIFGSIGSNGNVVLSSATGVYLASGDDIGVQSVGDTSIASQGTLTLSSGTVGAPPFPSGTALLTDSYLVTLAALQYHSATGGFYFSAPTGAFGLFVNNGSISFTGSSNIINMNSASNSILMGGSANNLTISNGPLSINVSDPAASLRFISIDPGTPATANEFLTLDTGNNVVLAAVPSGGGATPTNYWQTGTNSVLTNNVQIRGGAGPYNIYFGTSSYAIGGMQAYTQYSIQTNSQGVNIQSRNDYSLTLRATDGPTDRSLILDASSGISLQQYTGYYGPGIGLSDFRLLDDNIYLTLGNQNGTGFFRINNVQTGTPATANTFLTLDSNNDLVLAVASGGGATPANYWQTGNDSTITANIDIDTNGNGVTFSGSGDVVMSGSGQLFMTRQLTTYGSIYGNLSTGEEVNITQGSQTNADGLATFDMDGGVVTMQSSYLSVSPFGQITSLVRTDITGTRMEFDDTINSANRYISMNASGMFFGGVTTGTPATAGDFLTLDSNNNLVLATAGGGGGFSTSSKGIDNNGTDIYLGGQLAANDSILIDGNTNTQFYLGSSTNPITTFGIYHTGDLKFIDTGQATNVGITFTNNTIQLDRFSTNDFATIDPSSFVVRDNNNIEVLLGGLAPVLKLRNGSGAYQVNLSSNSIEVNYLSTTAGINIGNGADNTAMPTNSLLNVVGASISTSTVPTLVSGYSYIGRDNTTGVFGTFTPSSDERLKKSIMPIGDEFAMTVIRDIQPITFEWDLEKMPGNSEDIQFGFSAQNVQSAHEGLIKNSFERDGTQYIGVKDKQIAALLVAAVKDLDKRLQAIEQ